MNFLRHQISMAENITNNLFVQAGITSVQEATMEHETQDI